MHLARALICTCALVVAACGSSPAASTPGTSATLVIVVRQGPERVPFNPRLARIERADEQLTHILGHSLQLELDGALLPQSRDAAEDVIARLVEGVARELDGLGWDAKALAFARSHFDRLVIRYAPAEAAARDDGRRRGEARLDLATKTVDIAAPEARWSAISRGDLATLFHRAFTEGTTARYASVLPDALPRQEQRNWFEYHTHAADAAPRADDPYARVGSIDALRVRGMVLLHGLAIRGGDVDLAKDVRAWLVHAASDFATTYHHNAAEVEGAPRGSSFRQAESAWTSWMHDELPRMTLEERDAIASQLFVIDFRKEQSERDRFASYAFTGVDRMAFSLGAVDDWIRAGHPSSANDLYERVVCPANVDTKAAQRHYSNPSCDGIFYRWALADRSREDTLVKAVLARSDVPFATATFTNARRSLRDEQDYLRLLRRFEGTPALWKIGADVQDELVYRPSAAMREEARRWWRELPTARGQAFLCFARAMDESYDKEKDWPELLQGSSADAAALGAFLDLGWNAFELLPSAWGGIAKGNGRIRIVTAHARELLGIEIPTRSGGNAVASVLSGVAHALCMEGATNEMAELRAFAQTELATHPGSGLSDVVAATDPSTCTPLPKKKKARQ